MDLSNENVLHIQKDGVEYLQFKKLLAYQDIINHAYSLGLNKNYRTAKANKEKLDQEAYEKAIKDYQELCYAINSKVENLVKTNQEHTNEVKVAKEKINKEGPDFNLEQYARTDGLVTNQKEMMLSTTNADCILLLFFDPVKRVIANTHSGWRGTLQRISVKTVQKMKKEFDCNPEDIICCICPSIRKCHFEVEKDVKERFEMEFQDLVNLREIIEETIPDKKWHIDTVKINQAILQKEGLRPDNIVDSGICSVCHSDLIHSYRVEKQGYGLNTALIELCRIGDGSFPTQTSEKNRPQCDTQYDRVLPNRLKLGDTIGVVAPSNPIIGENVEELERAKEIVEKNGFKVKFSKNIYANTNGYSGTAKEKAEDINEMFQDQEVKMIWCAKGGENSNSVFDYLNYEIIKQNPKIICGYSDVASIISMINARTGLVTFNGTNFKTIATDETDYSFKEAIKRFVEGSLELGRKGEKYRTIQEGQTEGQLVGGNLSIIKGMIEGKYKLDFENKILFLEELGLETSPALASNYLYYMKQNGVFDQIKGMWIGNYQHESKITLEQIILDTLGSSYTFPIIQSDNFGHIETKTVIPIGIKARIDTNKSRKIELIEQCLK